jgi:histone H3/H4
MAKPWATSHISTVASGLGIELRISGDVKTQLVDILEHQLKMITREMENQTLESDPERKTLDDPNRMRLGFSRTRGMMIDNISRVDSIGAAAVVSANEQLENYLLRLLRLSSDAAAIERVGTIKPRHLDKALERIDGGLSKQENSETEEIQLDPIEDVMGEISGEILTPTMLRNMAKKFAGKPLDNDALEELLLLYYDHASNIQHDLQDNLANASHIIQMIERFQSLTMLGWMRRMLKEAGERADRTESKTVTLAHIVEVDPWD